MPLIRKRVTSSPSYVVLLQDQDLLSGLRKEGGRTKSTNAAANNYDVNIIRNLGWAEPLLKNLIPVPDVCIFNQRPPLETFKSQSS